MLLLHCKLWFPRQAWLHTGINHVVQYLITGKGAQQFTKKFTIIIHSPGTMTLKLGVKDNKQKPRKVHAPVSFP